MDEGWVTMDDQLVSSASSIVEDSDDGGLQASVDAPVFSFDTNSHTFGRRLVNNGMRHLQGLSSGQENDAEDCDDEEEAGEEEEESDSAARQSSDESASTIAEIFRCFICLGNVVDAHMCPSCSKICCLACIKRWLTDQRPQCPHCRASLGVSQLVNCRFIADIQGELEKIQGKAEGRSSENPCSVHENQPLTYYCKTCTKCVCSDCAVFDEAHRGHAFEKLSAAYERHLEVIRAEAGGLYQRLKELCALVAAVDKNITTVHKAKDDCSAELQVAVEDMQNRLEQQLKQKLLALLAQKGGMTQEVEVLDAMLHKLNKELNTCTKGELIARSDSIQRMLKDVHRRPTSDFARAPVSAEFVSEIVPPYDHGEFLLKDYDKKLRKAAIAAASLPSGRVEGSGDGGYAGGEVVYSEPINAGGVVWRLKVYPNGNGNARGMYLSVFLEMVQGGQEPAKYEYRVEMVHRRLPHLCIVREFASPFEVGECWGYNRFFRLDCLEKDGYLFPNEDDKIHLRFYVRTPTYGQQCIDLRRALALARQEKVEAEAQIAMLQRAFADTLWWNRRRRCSRASSSGAPRPSPGRHGGSHGRPQASGAAARRSGARHSRAALSHVFQEGRDVESDSAIAPLRTKLLEDKELLQSVMGPSRAANRLLPDMLDSSGGPNASKQPRRSALHPRNPPDDDDKASTRRARQWGNETDENAPDTCCSVGAPPATICRHSMPPSTTWEVHSGNQAVDEELHIARDENDEADDDDDDDDDAEEGEEEVEVNVDRNDDVPGRPSAPEKGEAVVEGHLRARTSENEGTNHGDVIVGGDVERVILEVLGDGPEGVASSSEDGCVIVQVEAVPHSIAEPRSEVGVTEVTGAVEAGEKAVAEGGEGGGEGWKPVRLDSMGSSSGWSDNSGGSEVLQFDLDTDGGSECEGFSLESSLGGEPDKESLRNRDSDMDSLLSYNICRLSPISEPIMLSGAMPHSSLSSHHAPPPPPPYVPSPTAGSTGRLPPLGWANLYDTWTRSGTQTSRGDDDDGDVQLSLCGRKPNFPLFDRFAAPGCTSSSSSSLLQSNRPLGLECSILSSSSGGGGGVSTAQTGKGLLSLSGGAPQRSAGFGPIGPRRGEGAGGSRGVGCISQCHSHKAGGGCSNQGVPSGRHGGQLRSVGAAAGNSGAAGTALKSPGAAKQQTRSRDASSPEFRWRWDFLDSAAQAGLVSQNSSSQAVGDVTPQRTGFELTQLNTQHDVPQADPWQEKDARAEDPFVGPSLHPALDFSIRPSTSHADSFWMTPLCPPRPLERGRSLRLFEVDDLHSLHEAFTAPVAGSCPEPEQDSKGQKLSIPSPSKCAPMLESAPWSNEHWWHREVMRLLERPLPSDSASSSSGMAFEEGEIVSPPLQAEEAQAVPHLAPVLESCHQAEEGEAPALMQDPASGSLARNGGSPAAANLSLEYAAAVRMTMLLGLDCESGLDGASEDPQESFTTNSGLVFKSAEPIDAGGTVNVQGDKVGQSVDEGNGYIPDIKIPEILWYDSDV